MTKSDGWNAYQRRRRAASGDAFGGLAAGEAAKLRVAAAAIVDGLSDALLGFGGETLLRFFAEHGALLGLSAEQLLPVRGSDAERVATLRALAVDLHRLPAPRGATLLDRQLRWLGDTLGLLALDRRILGVFARTALIPAWRELASAAPGGGHRLRVAAVAQLARAAPDAVEARLQPSSPLLGTGLVIDEQDGDYHAGRFLRRVAHLRSADPELLSARMLPPAPASTLAWDDFAHLGTLRDVAERAVAVAAGENRGVNLLLHGVPGTGKSEFVRLLAGRLGLRAVFAGLADESGEEPNRHERLAHLAVLRALTRGSAGHLIVIDEAEDVLRLPHDGDRAQMSKLWLNRLVEDVHAPTVWITNDPDALGVTAVRRMTLALGFDLPPRPVRARVVERHAARAGVMLGADEVARVAALPVAPAVLANAVEAARLAGGGGDTARAAGESILRALGGAPPVERRTSVYDPALSHADQDLPALADRLARAPARGWSLLLSGPSGTGKSAYARHLAERLGIEVDERRGSDLLSPYVGGTEANIADAFRASAESGSLLLIDEADSFLFDRLGAQRSWETGMVNEMLRWMEALRSPFVATTNLHDTLDPATQRRFTLRVALRALTPARAAALFPRYFGAPLPGGTEPLEGLTPGDFGVVLAARATLLGEDDATTLLRWLLAEVEVRGSRRGRPGFHLPAPEPRFRLTEEA